MKEAFSTQGLLDNITEAKLIEWAEEKFERARKNRLRFERQWYMNIAFYMGRQNVQWAAKAANNLDRLIEPPAPPWRVRLISNKIRPIIRTELAKVTKERPQAYVIPASTDDDDLLAARAGEAIFEHLWREIHMNRVIRRVMFWTLLCGSSFSKDYFDARSKDSTGAVGKICVEHVSPFHFFVPDPQEEELENQPYVIHCTAKDPEWVYRRFGKRVAPNSASNSGLLESKFLTALGIDDQPKQFVSVKEMWVKPCEKYPEGGVIIWTGDTLLREVKGWPYLYTDYPFTKFDHVPSGKFYADSVIPDLIPLQREYNRTRSQIVEAKNRMAKPQLMAPRGSVDPNKITSEPGLIVFYTPGYQPPSPIPLQDLPSYVVQELDRCQRDMDDISSQHEVTKGRTPPGVTAATAISYLQEEDDSKLSATISSLEEGVEKIGRHLLNHVQQFWAAERQVKVIGDSGQYESYAFTAAALKGNTDLKVESGSAAPRSRAAKQAFLTELGKLGWLPPDRVLRYLDMAETGKLYEELQVDARQAQRENYRMQNFDPQTMPPVNPNTFDNHAVHIEEHNLFRKKQAFESLTEEQKMMFELHVQTHMQALAQSMGGMIVPGMPLPLGGGDPNQQGNQGSTEPPMQGSENG